MRFLLNSTESMNATHMISTRMDVAIATMASPLRFPGRTLMHRAMAIPLFLYEVIRMSDTLCFQWMPAFFSTFSTETGHDLSTVFTSHIGAEWSHTFAPGYVLGAKLDTYLCAPSHESLTNNFCFGVFLRCSPHILIKRFAP